MHFLFPGGILFACCCAILYGNSLDLVDSAHIDIAGLIIFVFALFLGWRFDRNRLVYAIILLLIADLADRWYISHSSFVTLHHIVSILVPLNFILLALMRERGIRSTKSLLQLMFIPLQALLIYLWTTKWDSIYQEVLEISHLPKPLHLVPDLLLVAVCLALIVQLIRYFNIQNPLETALLWAILCASIASLMTPGIEPTLFRIFSILIITVSALEMSYVLAYRDELTSLPSRRALNEAFRKLGGQYVIAMADIDHFKKLNDTFGHDIGDQVLKMVAARLMKCRGGQAYRYGGEEFCIIFKGKMAESVMPYLEQLRALIADEPFIVRQKLRPVKKPKNPKQTGKTRKNIKVTISIGLAGKDNKLKVPEDVLKAADQALYRAKKSGRNRVSK